ncbi:hypothetical protein COCON_G00215250 [Conger conger]|uniref:VWFD domain-containing protein n=1 Tax=Conger conger TaxID=82655 RepID=A0A9Q1HPB0_CONCO|nr:hypothetical protein COCON_G00215250 [Conger conger]
MAKTALWTRALVLIFAWVSQGEALRAHSRNHVNSICSTWGKDHFKTFDGDIYQFPGMCEYNLASDCHEAYLDFSVHMKRAEVNGHPTVSRIVVTIKDVVIVLTEKLVTLNGDTVTTPYYGSGVLLERNTIYTKLYAKLGLSIMWNGEDAVTPQILWELFQRLGREISPIEFGNRQKVHLPTEYCEDPSEEEEFEDSGYSKCSTFHKSCAELLRSEAWRSCALVLSPEPYIQACVRDMCSCGDVPDDFCICSTLAEYSRQCSHAGGTPPNWRTPNFCAMQTPACCVRSTAWMAVCALKDCVGSKFSVLGQLVPCGSQELDTCLKSVVLLLNNDKTNALVIKADGKMHHNAEISLPYTTANVHAFRASSFHIILQTDFGLELQIQLVPIMQLYITLDRTYLRKTCGLCGNFNMVLHDDLKTLQGLVEGTAASFANSWKAQASCPNRMERLDDPCSLSVENENYAEYWCSMLQSRKSEFSKCHTVVNPEVYYRRCKYSSCNCEKSEDCLCAVFSSYVRACQAKGIELQGWRTNVCGRYTETCPASQMFSYQLQQCQKTCQSLGSERPSCSTDFLPVDGCSCPEGLYQDDRGVCVPMAKCPCYHNGDHIKPGKSITIKNEHWWEFFSCSSAQPNAQGIECARTCSNQNGDCFSSECESGCQCPSGLLDDGRENCVKEHDCPCLHDGHFYAPGRQIADQCNT